jgi:CBS domain-containing protein
VLVKDIMSRPVYTIGENRTAKDAGKLMKKIRRGCVIVTKNKKAVGILTDSDLIRRVISKDVKASQVKIKSIMSTPLVTVKPEDDVIVAVRKIKKSNIHRLPVVKKGRVVGIISSTDIARTSPEMLDLLEYRLKMKGMPFEIKEEFTSGICDSCGNLSEDLKKAGGQWLCESCRDELESER